MIYKTLPIESMPGYVTQLAGCISNKLKKSAKRTNKFSRIDLLIGELKKKHLWVSYNNHHTVLLCYIPSHISDVFRKHMEHIVWQIFL